LKNFQILLLLEKMNHLYGRLMPSCVESEAIPYELLITVMINVGEALRNWGFYFILTGYHRADIACQQR
jgi:hypothetical protein